MIKTLITLMFLFSSLPVWADIINLKNGRSIEGVIEKENDTTIFVNVGFGLTGINRGDIASIEKASRQDLNQLQGKWRKEYFSRPEFTPNGLEDVSESYVELEKTRKTALDDMSLAQSNRDQMKDLDEELQKLKKTAELLGLRLSEAQVHNDITTYNGLVSDYNAVNAKIQLNRIKFDDLNKSLISREEAVSNYSKDLSVFKNLIEQKKNPAILMDQARADFLKTMEARAGQLEGDFNKYAVGYSNSNGSMVTEVLLNQRVKARLVVDTGASLVVISRGIATQLGIEPGKNNFFYTTVADGSKVKAYPVLLGTLQVGNALAHNVQAAVLEENSGGIGDGLLGMSFLGNFALEIDAKNNSLILKEFKIEQGQP